jgi:hypothetical protein
MEPRAGRRRWTDDQLRAAVAKSRSVYGVLRELGLRVGGGQHQNIKRRIRELALDVSHFTGQGWNVGDARGLLRSHRREWDLQEILVRDSPYRGCSSGLKRRLLKEGILRERCYECDAPPEWRGKPLVLRLDHVNGDRCDQRLENLRLLCPNCDSQTPTFAGRNKGRVPW